MFTRMLTVALFVGSITPQSVLFAGFPPESPPKILTSPKKSKGKCWQKRENNMLSVFMQTFIRRPLDAIHKNNNYIQTFGCAYEDDDIEQNSVRAVYRAINQSLKNRNVVAVDNIRGLLKSRPPRPDNLIREYTIYVRSSNIAIGTQARYEIKILDLDVISTFESERAVYTKIITRFSYQQDFKNSVSPVDKSSEFIEIMQLAERVLKEADNGTYKKINQIINSHKTRVVQIENFEDLTFGDRISLFLQNTSNSKEIPAFYLGKGIYIIDIPDVGTRILKFGDEQLFGLYIDSRSFRRLTDTFIKYQYHAPESILQCLLLRYNEKLKNSFEQISTLDK